MKMKQYVLLVMALLGWMGLLQANPVDAGKAKAVGQKFVAANFNNNLRSNELQLVYIGLTDRSDACLY